MSWSLYVSGVTPAEAVDALKENHESQREMPQWGEKTDAQFEAACEAIEKLLNVIDYEKVNISASGHAQQSGGESPVPSVSVSVSGAYIPEDG